MQQIVSEYVDKDSGKVKYKDIISDLRTFDYDESTNNRVIKSSHSMTSSRSEFLGQFKTTKTLFDDDYIVLDS